MYLDMRARFQKRGIRQSEEFQKIRFNQILTCENQYFFFGLNFGLFGSKSIVNG